MGFPCEEDFRFQEGSKLLLDGKDGLVAEGLDIGKLILLDHGPQLLAIDIEKPKRFSINDDGEQHECLGGNGFEIPTGQPLPDLFIIHIMNTDIFFPGDGEPEHITWFFKIKMKEWHHIIDLLSEADFGTHDLFAGFGHTQHDTIQHESPEHGLHNHGQHIIELIISHEGVRDILNAADQKCLRIFRRIKHMDIMADLKIF